MTERSPAVPAADAGEAERVITVAFPAPGTATIPGPIDGVALVTLDRPKALNAISFALLEQLTDALEALDVDPACRAIVITGSGERAFAAGVDIVDLRRQTPVTFMAENHFHRWERIKRIRTPLVAAVRGFALGGGCELALTCDLIVAGDDAQFGQPEVRLGVTPGAGGTQRLTHALGKAKAMEMILTGRTMGAREAEARGLVSTVVPAEATVAAALELAAGIAGQPPLAVIAATEAIDRAFELSLEAGLEYERLNFYLLFGSEDQDEGMAAFVEKRTPVWRGR